MFSKRDWLLLVIACGLIVLGVWLELTVPEFLREITLIVTGGRDGDIGDVWRYGGLMVGFAVASMITTVIVAFIAAIVSSSHSARIRQRVFGKVGEFSLGEMKKFSIASLITRSTNDVNQVNIFTIMAIQVLIRAPIMAIWAIMKIVGVSWELSIVTIIGIALLVIVMTIIIAVGVTKFFKIQKLTDNLNQVARENLTGIRVVRAYNAQDFEQNKFDKANKDLTKNNVTVNRALGVFWPFFGFLMSAMTAAIYWVGSWVIDSGRTDEPMYFFGDLMVFTQYSSQVIFSFMMLIMVLVFFPRAMVSGRRIMEVLRTKPSVVGAKSEVPLKMGNGNIEFRNVNFKYPGAEENVLSNINLSVKKGSRVAFIGGTGCGKSTLVNLLPRIYDATCGDVLIGGRCVKDMSLEELNTHVGYVPQTATLFSGTIKSNVAFGHLISENGAREITDDEVVQALKTAQAWEFVSKLEDGINSEVSQVGKNFSGGQKQRLAIARILARKPEIIIFDDTFSALDYKTDRTLRTALAKDLAGATILIVAQRVGTIKDCDQIYVMDKGRIVSFGRHEELLKKCDVYKEINDSQFLKEGGK